MSALRAALLTAAAISLWPVAAGANDTGTPKEMRVDYDQSTVLRLDRPAKTVVVGNPLIADALLVSDKTVYVLGRMFGNTNVIAVDAEGNEIANTRVTVGAPVMAQVTLYRGANGQRNLACAPHCERTVTQGDAEMQGLFADADKKVDVSRKSGELSAERR